MGHDRPITRVVYVRIGNIPGVHVVTTPVVVGFAGAHRSDNRHVMHLLGHQRHVLGNLNVSRGADRLEWSAVVRTWLEIPDIHRRWATTHPQQDTGFAVLLERVGMDSERMPKRQRTAEHRACAGHVRHEMTTGHPVGC